MKKAPKEIWIFESEIEDYWLQDNYYPEPTLHYICYDELEDENIHLRVILRRLKKANQLTMIEVENVMQELKDLRG